MAESSLDMKALMGKTVTPTVKLRRTRWGGRREWVEEPIGGPGSINVGRAAWVVGHRFLQNGEIRRIGTHENIFVQEDTVPAVLVTYWPSMKPFPVPEDGFELGGEPVSTTKISLDIAKRRGYYDHGEQMREVMKDWPRDEKGRWLPWESANQQQRNEVNETIRIMNERIMNEQRRNQ
jgi:hypothetical protein